GLKTSGYILNDLSSKGLPQIESEIKYLQRNKISMNYFDLHQKKLPIGSGVLEAFCKELKCNSIETFAMNKFEMSFGLDYLICFSSIHDE
ncbi:MAG: hypothetical protein PVG74_14915, partial [Desulfobacterales bacterium]